MTRSGIASRQRFDVESYLQLLHQSFAGHQGRQITRGDGPGVFVYRGPGTFSIEWLHTLLAASESAASSLYTVRTAGESAGHTGSLLGACVLWRTPNGATRVAVGSCLDIPVSGADRFTQVRRILTDYPTRLSVSAGDETVRPALWFVGAAFAAQQRFAPWADWPDARVLLPRFVFEQSHDGQTSVTCHIFNRVDTDFEAELARLDTDLRFCADAVLEHPKCGSDEVEAGRAASRVNPLGVDLPSTPAAAPDAIAFLHAVTDTAAEIRDGLYEKAVLARSDVIQVPARTGIEDVVRRLVNGYPDTFVYAVRTGDSWFVGASPERLVRVCAGQAAIDCLAGTIGRGDTVAADDQFGFQLLASTKDRQEHQVVVRWVTEQLSDLLDGLSREETPKLKKLQNVQHLWTEVTGQVRPGVSAVDLMARLHPTPAVAGVPRDTALQVIAAREPMDRGWYAGPIGWADDSGDGEFAVALRSALFTGSDVHLYAGVGIMGDSDPDAEWQETALKLQAMRTAIIPQNSRQVHWEERTDADD